jgi:hypothetical protein
MILGEGAVSIGIPFPRRMPSDKVVLVPATTSVVMPTMRSSDGGSRLWCCNLGWDLPG